jgi:hypothetical protein
MYISTSERAFIELQTNMACKDGPIEMIKLGLHKVKHITTKKMKLS